MTLDSCFSKKRAFIFVISLLSCLAPLLVELYTPSFLTIAKDFSIPDSFPPLSLSCFFFAFSFGQLFFGPLSESIGRRPLLLFGLVFSIFGTALVVVSPNFYLFLVGRCIQGIGISAPVVLQKTLLRDSFTGHALTIGYSYVLIFTVICASLTPLAGSYVEFYLNWRLGFVLIGVMTFILFLCSFIYISETKKESEKTPFSLKKTFQIYLHLLKNPFFLGCIFSAALPALGLISFYASAPYIFSDLLSESPVHYGWLVTLPIIGLIFGLTTHGPLLRRKGRHRTLAKGIYTLIFATFMFFSFSLLQASSYWLLVFPLIIYNIGTCWIQPNAIAAALGPYPHYAGYASALYGSIRVLLTSINLAILSLFNTSTNASPQSPFPLAFSILIIGLICYGLQAFLFEKAMHHFEGH